MKEEIRADKHSFRRIKNHSLSRPDNELEDIATKKPTIEFVEDEATKKARAMLAGTTADDLPEFVEALADTIRKLSIPQNWVQGEVGIERKIETSGHETVRIQLDKIRALKDNDHHWGYELWLCNDKEDNLCVKLLVIEPEKYGSLHSHTTKQERFILLSGEIDLYICSGSRILAVCLTIGQTFMMGESNKHRICNPSQTKTALLLEVSSYEDDDVEKYLPSGTGKPSFEPVETDYDDLSL